MICQSCKKKPSTGILFDLCDECWEVFDAKVQAAKDKGQMYDVPDAEIAFLCDELVDRKKN